jgi:uncharacterized protein YjlB
MKQFKAGLLLPEHTAIFLLDDDGIFPNNEHLPVLFYEHALQVSNPEEAGEEIEKIITENFWHHTWKNGIYDYHHYHSTAHEVLVCLEGIANVQLGGPSGVSVNFKQGDVLILPAGTAHKANECSSDFQCLGAYPQDQLFDMNYGKTEERSNAMQNILQVPLPKADPIYNMDGPLAFHWNLHVEHRV